MDSARSESDPQMQVRTRASSVIVHHIRPNQAERFLELQRGISEVAKTFPGYQATDVYPPADPQQPDWVVVVHFEGPEALHRWLDSPVRAEWIQKMRSEVGEFQLKALPTGFGAWFAEMVAGGETGPPSWKIALSVLLALYPTVMLLAILVGPHLNPLGLAVSMLIANALSVSILQWAVMPAIRKLLARWLRANDENQRGYSLGGLAAILLLLAGMTAVFYLVKG